MVMAGYGDTQVYKQISVNMTTVNSLKHSPRTYDKKVSPPESSQIMASVDK